MEVGPLSVHRQYVVMCYLFQPKKISTRAPMFLKAEARGVRGEKEVLEVAGGGRRWPGCA